MSSYIDSSQAGIGYSRQAVDEAIVRHKSLIDRYRNTPPDTFLHSLADRLVALNRYDDFQRWRKWQYNLDYYRTGGAGQWDSKTGFWLPDGVDRGGDDHEYVNNQYRRFIKRVAAHWGKSRTVVTRRSRTNDPVATGNARILNNLLAQWWDRRWKPEERQIEGRHAQLFGNYIRHLYTARSGGELVAFKPKIEQQRLAGEEEGYFCQECGTAGPMTELTGGMGAMSVAAGMNGEAAPPAMNGACPDCGSEELAQFGVPAMTIDVVTGQEAFDPFDVYCEPCDPGEFRLHGPSLRMKDSPYMTRTRLFLLEVLQHHFEGMQLSPGDLSTDFRLMAYRALRSGTGYGIRSDGLLQDLAGFEEVWVSPEMYSFYVTPRDVGASKVILDPNTKMIEMYPNGFYFSRVGKEITGKPRAEDKMDWFIHGRWDIVPGTIWGDGQDDAVEQNEMLNYGENLHFDILMNHASRMTGINPLRIDSDDITGSPEDIFLLQNPDHEDRPGDFIYQSQPSGAPPDLSMFNQNRKATLEELFSAYAAFNGQPMPGSQTASEVLALRDQSAEPHDSPLELKSQCDIRTEEIVTREFQRNHEGMQWLITGGQYDDWEGQFFSAQDIQGDFELRAKPGSWSPRPDAEERAAAIEAGAWGGFQGGIFNPEVPPKLRRFMLEKYNLNFEADDVARDYRKQRREIATLEEMLPEVLAEFEAQGIPIMLPPGIVLPSGAVTEEEIPNPLVVSFLTKKIPVERMLLPGEDPTTPAPSIDNDPVHIAAIVEWLGEDKGVKAHPVLRSALMVHAREHWECQAATQQFVGMNQLQGQAPMLMAEQALAGGNKQAQPKGRTLSTGTKPKSKGTGDGDKVNAPTSRAKLKRSRTAAGAKVKQ